MKLHPSFERIPLGVPTPDLVVEGVACLRSLETRQASTGSPFLVVGLGHRDGSTTVKIWSDAMPAWSDLKVGDALHLRLRGKAGRGTYRPEWTVQDVHALSPDHPIRDDLLPRCPIPISELATRWTKLLAELTPTARVLLEVVLDHVGVEAYWRAPAATHMHHAVAPYGLAWHSIEVGEFALGLARGCATYERELDVDLLVLGALLHDVGKVLEYDVTAGVGIQRSAKSYARYHTTLGIELIAGAVACGRTRLQAAGVQQWLIDSICAVIESHHVRRDFGSPTEPTSREAWLLHAADMASARLEALTAELTSATPLAIAGWYQPRDSRSRPVQRFDLIARDPAHANADVDVNSHSRTEPLPLLPLSASEVPPAPEAAAPTTAPAVVEFILIPESAP